MWYAIGIGVVVVGFVIWLICHYWAVCAVMFTVLFGAGVAFGLTFVLNMMRRYIAYDSVFPRTDEDYSGKECLGFSLSIMLGGVVGYWFGFGNFSAMLYALGGTVALAMSIIVWRGIVESKQIAEEYASEQRRMGMLRAERTQREDAMRQEQLRRDFERKRRENEMRQERLRREEEERREHEKFVQSLYDKRISQKEMMALRALCDRRSQEITLRWGPFINDIKKQVRDVTAWRDVDRQQTFGDALEGEKLFQFVKNGGEVVDVTPPHAEIIVSFIVHGALYKAYLRFVKEEVYFARFKKDRIYNIEWNSVLNEIDGYLCAGDEDATGWHGDGDDNLSVGESRW